MSQIYRLCVENTYLYDFSVDFVYISIIEVEEDIEVLERKALLHMLQSFRHDWLVRSLHWTNTREQEGDQKGNFVL